MSLFRRLLSYLWRQDRRRYVRIVNPPLRLRIDGKRYDTVDWSLGGFKIRRYHRGLSAGDQIQGEIRFDTVKPGEFVAEVIQVQASGDIGLRLLEITPATFLAMSGVREL